MIIRLFVSLYFLANLATTFAGIRRNSTDCDRRCAGERVDFPFGFSEGCEFRLNCSSDGKIGFQGFAVRNITSESLILSIAGNCSRPIEDLLPLSGENYALGLRNGLLLRNCSSPVNGCVVPWSLLENRFDSGRTGCGGSGGENMSCFALPGTAKGGVMRFKDVNATGCRILYSSMVVDSDESSDDSAGDSSDVTLAFQSVQVSWWLNGSCDGGGGCDANAVCRKVLPAGYRCHCNAGFAGDGYAAGIGCRVAGWH